MADYTQMTTEEFDAILVEVINEDLVGHSQTPAGEKLLSIAGIYEVLSEHYNNKVLDTWAERNPETAGTEEAADG